MSEQTKVNPSNPLLEALDRKNYKTAFRIVGEDIHHVSQALNGEIREGFDKAFNKFKRDMQKVMHNINEGAKETWQKISKISSSFMEQVSAKVNPVLEKIGDGARFAWDKMVDTFKTIGVYCDTKIKAMHTSLVKASDAVKSNWQEKIRPKKIRDVKQDLAASDQSSAPESWFDRIKAGAQAVVNKFR